MRIAPEILEVLGAMDGDLTLGFSSKAGLF
jgi:hypothetical protein